MGRLVFLFLIPYLLSTLSFPAEKNDDEMTGLIIYFRNEMDTSGNWIKSEQLKELSNLSNQLCKEIASSSIIKNLDNNNCKCLSDSIYILNLEGVKAFYKDSEKFSPGYFIIGAIKSYNHLIYATAKVYFIYQDNPLKYLELFELKTRYYNKNGLRSGVLNEKIVSEIFSQLKAGLDDNINVVVDPIKIDITQPVYYFLKNAVPEYLKSRLVISEKIKVHKDIIISSIPGLSKRPQYTVDGYVFDDRSRVHIIVHCTDNDENRVIISKETSFNIQNPDSLEIRLLEIGDEFRNAILNLYNSKVHKRKTGFAIIAVPPFFSNPENEDVYQMKSIVRKIIFSLISSFRTDSIMTDKFNFISDPNYFRKIDEYLNNNRELSIITNELNAEKLVVLQTIGNPVQFDLLMQLYDPKGNNELEKIDYLRKIEFNKVPLVIDSVYDTMKIALLKSININAGHTTEKFNEPSEFYELIPKKWGIEFNGLQSLFFKDKANLFLGNNLRPAIELAAYFSTAIFKIPVSFNISFLYDFGVHKEYQNFGETTDRIVTIYGRNLNFVIKGYVPFNARIKNNWRGYLGAGITFIDIHRVSSSVSIGSFEPGFISTIGTEYNINSQLYIDFNAHLLTSSIKFNTFEESGDSISEGHYTVFYLSTGIGYEF